MSLIASKAEALLSSLQSKGIDPSPNLKRGASDSAIRSYAKRLGCTLPPAVQDLYRWRNGNADPDAESERLLTFRDMAFLSLEDGLREKEQIDVFLATISGGRASPLGEDGYVPIGGFEGQYYAVPCGDHAFRSLSEHPVVSVGEGLAVHFLSIEAMLDTCNAWVADASYTLDTLEPENELSAWNRFNPGVHDESSIGWASSEAAEEPDALDVHDLYEAVAEGDEARALSILASGVRVDDTDAFGRTLMHDSIRRGITAAKLALTLGCDINAECSKHWTPLFHLRKYEDPTDKNLTVHAWAESCGAIAKPDRFAESWKERT